MPAGLWKDPSPSCRGLPCSSMASGSAQVGRRANVRVPSVAGLAVGTPSQTVWAMHAVALRGFASGGRARLFGLLVPALFDVLLGCGDSLDVRAGLPAANDAAEVVGKAFWCERKQYSKRGFPAIRLLSKSVKSFKRSSLSGTWLLHLKQERRPEGRRFFHAISRRATSSRSSPSWRSGWRSRPRPRRRTRPATCWRCPRPPGPARGT